LGALQDLKFLHAGLTTLSLAGYHIFFVTSEDEVMLSSMKGEVAQTKQAEENFSACFVSYLN
jgi:hypothetical protein